MAGESAAVGTRTWSPPWLEPAAILGGAAALSALVVAFDLDLVLARMVFDPQRDEIRSWTNSLASYSMGVAAAGLLWLAIPPLRRSAPLLSRCAGVFVMTLLVAVLGLITNLKIERDRPRPSEVVEFGGEFPYHWPFGDERCACKSFPSSAAGFGYLLATPFFVLRRRKPQAAVAFLAGGLLWGSYIGYGRMVANMHWLTDVIWSAALVLATASVVSALDVRWRDDPPAAGPNPST